LFLKWNNKSNTNTTGTVNNAYDHLNESSITRSPVAQDLNSSDEDIKDTRILWIRNVKRIQMQVKRNFPGY
jgi:hypothetical protein